MVAGFKATQRIHNRPEEVTMHYDVDHSFGPLKKYLADHPEHTNYPWEYMGHDEDGEAHYRARPNVRLVLADPKEEK